MKPVKLKRHWILPVVFVTLSMCLEAVAVLLCFVIFEYAGISLLLGSIPSFLLIGYYFKKIPIIEVNGQNIKVNRKMYLLSDVGEISDENDKRSAATVGYDALIAHTNLLSMFSNEPADTSYGGLDESLQSVTLIRFKNGKVVRLVDGNYQNIEEVKRILKEKVSNLSM